MRTDYTSISVSWKTHLFIITNTGMSFFSVSPRDVQYHDHTWLGCEVRSVFSQLLWDNFLLNVEVILPVPVLVKKGNEAVLAGV